MAADIIIDKIQFKRGVKANMPVLDAGEPFLCTDGDNAGEMWVGTKERVNKVVNDLTEFKQVVVDYNQAKTDTETAIVNANTAATNADTKATELEQRVEASIATTTNSAEIIDARGGEPLLKNRLDNVDAQLAQKASKEEVNLQLGNLADATPKFANSTAEMTDNTKLYVNLSDGYLYSHNGTSWISTGVQYQSKVGSVTSLPVNRHKWDSNKTALFFPRSTSDITSISGTIATDNTILFEGGSTVKWTSVNNTVARATVNFGTKNLTDVDALDFNIYIDNFVNMATITISLWNGAPATGVGMAFANLEGTNFFDIVNGVKDNGWRYLRALKSKFVNDATPLNWADVKYMRLDVRSKTGTTVNINFGKIETMKLQKGVLYMDFDDAVISQYNTAFPIMRDYNLKGNLNIITSFLGQTGYMNWNQVHEMLNAGWAIHSHTHTHRELGTLTEAELHEEFKNTQEAMRTHRLDLGSLFIIAPKGSWSDLVDSVAKQYFEVCRMYSVPLAYYPRAFPQSHNRDQRYYSVLDEDSTATLIAEIDKAIAQKGEILLNFHNVGTVGYPEANFRTVCEYIKSKVDEGVLMVPTRYEVFLQSKSIQPIDDEGFVYKSFKDDNEITVNLK